MLAEVLREIDKLPLDPVLFVAPLEYLIVGHAKNGAAVANPQGLGKRLSNWTLVLITQYVGH